MNDDDKFRLREIKGMWGWAVAALWIVYWWWQHEQTRQAALARGCEDSIVGNIGDAIFGAGSSCRSAIDNEFNGGMFWAVVTSPLAFILVHYYAKWKLGQVKAYEDRMVQEVAERRERDRRSAHEASMAEITERGKQDQLVSRQAGERFEVITRLGAVDDQLVVLENEASSENIKLIKLNIGQSIRDLHAKFTDEELAAQYLSDEGLRQRVDRTLAEMRRVGLSDTRFHDDLSALFRVGTTA